MDPFLVGLALGIVLTVLLLWGRTPACACIQPFLNEKGILSLSRMSAAALMGCLLWSMTVHPDLFWRMALAPAGLVFGVFLVLFADVIGGKVLATKTIGQVTSRFGIGLPGADPCAPPAPEPEEVS